MSIWQSLGRPIHVDVMRVPQCPKLKREISSSVFSVGRKPKLIQFITSLSNYFRGTGFNKEGISIMTEIQHLTIITQKSLWFTENS